MPPPQNFRTRVRGRFKSHVSYRKEEKRAVVPTLQRMVVEQGEREAAGLREVS